MVEDPIGLKDLTYDKILMALLRICMGFIWLWAFFDKLLGLGFGTAPENAWLAGGSPTQGYLSFAIAEKPLGAIISGILAPIYPLVDFALMGMLLIVGVALILGIFTRIGSILGIIFMLSIAIASWPYDNNPLIDDHLINTLVLLLFIVLPVGKWIGLGNWWSEFINNLVGENLGKWLE
ncbi:MAG: hypothetical protein ACFFCZ_23975 [Promethearchaeota archaeon]